MIGEPLGEYVKQTETPDGPVRIGDTIVDADNQAWVVTRIRREPGRPDMINAKQVRREWFCADSVRTMRSF